MNKTIHRYADIKDKIIHAVDLLTDPVRQTLSPKGGNVIYDDDNGNQHYTNDGYTIISHIQVADPVENAIIEIIKGGSRKTNLEAGDGTSSTLVASSVLIKEGLKLVENGENQMDVRDELNKFTTLMVKELKKKVTPIKTDEDIKKIALISSSNDKNIANDIVKIIKVAGEDGQVILDRGYSTETEVIEDTGFVVKSGIFAQELGNKQLQAGMLDVPIIVTDKRIYYKSEAETILTTALEAGYSEVVIVAQDFIGEALPYFVANHINNKIRVILVSEKKPEVLEDLAIYLGTEVVSDKKGALVDNITIDNFAMAKRVFTDPYKTIISRDKKESDTEINKRVKVLKNQQKKVGNKNDPEYLNLSRRISSLTTGMVTIKVAGATGEEILEKIHRYEDAVNAARAAMKEGYLPGAGVSVLNAYCQIEKNFPEKYKTMFRAVAEYNVRQIAENCGKSSDVILDKVLKSPEGQGYNAVTDKVEDVMKAGIIEPFIVTSQVIANAVSIANIIITSKYLIVNDIEANKKD